ncbi:MAG: hypothetical protein ACI9FG_000340 [Crocinitomicaceae bacterium]|jgi:hypothetical protein
MNTCKPFTSYFSLNHADRVGAAASVLCAIHCGVAPVLLILLPTFGKIWAHPASHALVALFIVPLAIFSIYKGYRLHQKRWVLALAAVGIFFVLSGAILPAFSHSSIGNKQEVQAADFNQPVGCSSDNDSNACEKDELDKKSIETVSSQPVEAAGCVDACCPSVEVSETGEMSLHIPPAAIITTLGGIFLIAAHIGNLCQCGHACRVKECCPT